MSLTQKWISSLAIVCLTWVCASTEAFGQATQSLKQSKVSTPLTETELLVALRDSHEAEYGQKPNAKKLAMAWAQVALENAHGSVMWNHNLGNVGPGATHEWYQHSPLARYRSFKNFIDGGRAYWRVVTWCKAAIAMFDAGQPVRATENLKRCGYFEADLDPYIKGMTSLYNYALTKLIPNEERARRQEELANRRWEEYQLTHAFTPACACSWD